MSTIYDTIDKAKKAAEKVRGIVQGAYAIDDDDWYNCIALFCSNEKTGELLKNENVTVGRAYSVLASGDQVFDMINYGFQEIDTFDINFFCVYYVLGLKKTMILKYSYDEYFTILKKLFDVNTSNEEITSIISDLLICMNQPYQTFWEEIIKIQFRTNKNFLATCLFRGCLSKESLIETHSYLENEDVFNAFKVKLVNAKITFECEDLKYIIEKGLNKSNYYTFMYFSNILSEFSIEDKNNNTRNINNLVDKCLLNDGIAVTNYPLVRRKP